MRTLRLSLAGAVSLALLGGLGVGVVGQDPVDEPGEPDSFLFIGNSLTKWGDTAVYDEFERLLGSEDPSADPWIFRVIKGGTILGSNFDMTKYRLETGDYDVVILQDDIPVYQGAVPEDQDPDIEHFMDTARRFDEMLEEFDVETVFYMTWPPVRDSWVSLDEIVAVHRQAEQELGAAVAPVGLAFAKAEAELPELPMLSSDGDHPSMFGTYLAAATIYATIFDRSPEGLYFPWPDMPEERADTIGRIAWETVQEWQEETPAE